MKKENIMSKKTDTPDYKPSIYSLTRDELIAWAIEHGEKKFRASQIWDWLYKKRVQSFDEMTNISKDFIALLNENFVVNPLKQRIVQESADGTVKYLFELPDGMLIETVLMRQYYGLSVCVTNVILTMAKSLLKLCLFKNILMNVDKVSALVTLWSWE